MGEILDAIHRPLGATTLDGIKRRTRAGMGRCQAGFCTPKNMELLAEELHLELKDIRKTGRRDARREAVIWLLSEADRQDGRRLWRQRKRESMISL